MKARHLDELYHALQMFWLWIDHRVLPDYAISVEILFLLYHLRKKGMILHVNEHYFFTNISRMKVLIERLGSVYDSLNYPG